MMRKTLLIAFALLALTGAAALADVVVVNDANYSSLGWVAANEQGGAASPAVIDFQPGMGTPPAGSGSLHLQTKYDDSDRLQKVYFGTNNYSGISLSSITSLKVWTYLRYRDYSTGLPPIIELITDSGSSAQQRRYWYVPNQSAIVLNTWQEWDLMASGTTNGTWMLMGTSSTNYKGDWNWVVGRYVGSKLQTPYVGDFVDPLNAQLQIANQSGTSISFKIGAGYAVLSPTDASRYNNGDTAWWKTSCSINGYVDKFVIGVSGVETVYDFEVVPEPGAFVVFATGLVGLLGFRRRMG